MTKKKPIKKTIRGVRAKPVILDYHFICTVDTPREERKDKYIGDIYANQAECALCGDLIRSRNKHDYVTCKCGEISVDGGSWYCKRGAVTDLKNAIDKSIMFSDCQKPQGEGLIKGKSLSTKIPGTTTAMTCTPNIPVSLNPNYVLFNDDIAFYAFRYALGRMTYVVSDVCTYLKENAERLMAPTRNKIIKEIEYAIKGDRAGLQMDVEEWLIVVKFLRSVEND